jgi:hypothetical protein
VIGTVLSNVAQAKHDTIAAKKWAGAASILWAGADAPLQPVVRHMRAIVDGQMLSDSSNPSRRQ